MINVRFSMAFACLVFAGVSTAHQTNVTHPRVSQRALDMIRASDGEKREYYDLYGWVLEEDSPASYPRALFGGQARKFTRDQAVADEENHYPAFQANNRNLIDGVVAEDTPDGRVLDHFYHAYSTRGLLGHGGPSRERGVQYFLDAVELMGYGNDVPFESFGPAWDEMPQRPQTAAERQFDQYLSYWTFGHSLHHAEDMGSIAHTHDDAHLTLGNPQESTDDFEAIFIPFFFWRPGADTSPWFINSGCTVPGLCASDVTSFDAVWPPAAQTALEAPAASLNRNVYNAAIFQANLPFPGYGGVSWDSVPAPSGELVEMFTRPGATNSNFTFHAGRRLFWRAREESSYSISSNAPGLSLTYSPGSTQNSFWSADKYGGPRGYYYIEEHIAPAFSLTAVPLTCQILRPPAGVRRNLFLPYNRDSNPLVPFTPASTQEQCGRESLLGRIATQVMPLLTTTMASYSKWWFDVANSPPYLKRVTVQQHHNLVVQTPFTAYDAMWKDVAANGTYDEHRANLPTDWANNAAYGQTRHPFSFVSRRYLELNKKVPQQPISKVFDMELVLEFSEGIKLLKEGAYDSNSGFILGFETLARAGESSRKIWLTDKMSELTYQSMTKTAEEKPLNSEDIDRVWKITIPKSVLNSYDELKGAAKLIVKARDKNRHFDNRGAELDGDPSTPARRRVTRGSPDVSVAVHWHDKTSAIPEIFGTLPEGSFAYDDKDSDGQVKGDSNHILWFSDKRVAEVVEPASPPRQIDKVKLTLEPKKVELKP